MIVRWSAPRLQSVDLKVGGSPAVFSTPRFAGQAKATSAGRGRLLFLDERTL